MAIGSGVLLPRVAENPTFPILSALAYITGLGYRPTCDVLCNRDVLGVAVYDRRFGEGTGAILLDDVNCRGNEASLAECPHRAWGEHDCRHSEDVSVLCIDKETISITGKNL